MEVVTKQAMDLAQPDHALQVFCVQGDELSRKVELQLLANGRAWLIPEDTTILISYYKPDGTCGSYTQMPDGSTAWEINQNTIIFRLTPQMLTTEGLVSVQLKLMCHQETISTFAFQVLVRPGLAPGDSPESYHNWLKAYLPQTSGAENGQYLCITQVDNAGHVIEVTGMDLSILDDYGDFKIRINILEEKIAETETLDNRITAMEHANLSASYRIQNLEEKSRVLLSLDSRVRTLENASLEVKTWGQRVNSLENGVKGLDKIGERLSTLEDQYEDLGQLSQRVSDLENRAEDTGELESRVENLENVTTEIPRLNERIETLESGNSAYPAIWESKLKDCIHTIHQHQEQNDISCASFAFFSDNHNHSGCAGALLKPVMEDCGIPYTFFCGDMVTNGVLDDPQAVLEEIQQFNAMMAPIPREMDCRALGEADYCRMGSDGKIWPLRDSQIYERYFRNQYLSPQHKPGGKTYYYVEDRIAQIRYVVLNSVHMEQQLDEDGSLIIEEGYGFGQSQLDWLVSDALYFEEEGWSVVFIAHSPLSNQGTSNLRDAFILKGILAAFLNGDYYRDVCGGLNSVLIDVDFGSYCPADIIGWFSGHIHQDTIETLNLSDDYYLPFNVVTITSDGDHTGDQAHTIDFVTINKDIRRVDLTRLGYGQSRSFYY